MIVALILVAGVCAIDVVTGPEISFSLFYLIPIALIAWFIGRGPALAISIASAIAWFIADALSGQTYSHPAIRYWNATVRLGFFVVVTVLLPVLRALEREKELARVDFLTGAANRRLFYESLQRELERSQRYKRPLTVAFLDIDNFKAVNDRLSHVVGDKVLCAIAIRARSTLRRTDTVARFGGDEFVFLLPETNHEAARIAVGKIQSALLDEMAKHNWPVTFSIGVLTCVRLPKTTDDLMKRVDDLLYSAKNRGKNALEYDLYTG